MSKQRRILAASFAAAMCFLMIVGMVEGSIRLVFYSSGLVVSTILFVSTYEMSEPRGGSK